jgi:hypothetical protein
MSYPTGNRIVLHSDIPLEEMLAHLEGDHARVLVALLMYGTLTALEEGRITVDTGYRVVLNWPVMLYLEDNPKPRDHILVEAVSSSIEIDAISRHRGLHMVPRCCRDIKAKFAPWFAEYLGDSPVPSGSRSKKISLPTDVPLDTIMLDLEANHIRALVIFLIYGALTALEEGRITFDVAARVVLNRRALRHCKERLRPLDQALEEALADSGELEAAGNAGRHEDVMRLCAKMKTRVMT